MAPNNKCAFNHYQFWYVVYFSYPFVVLKIQMWNCFVKGWDGCTAAVISCQDKLFRSFFKNIQAKIPQHKLVHTRVLLFEGGKNLELRRAIFPAPKLQVFHLSLLVHYCRKIGKIGILQKPEDLLKCLTLYEGRAALLEADVNSQQTCLIQIWYELILKI